MAEELRDLSSTLRRSLRRTRPEALPLLIRSFLILQSGRRPDAETTSPSARRRRRVRKVGAGIEAARVRRRRETGKCEGRKPYGEKAGEAETLAYIRQLRRKPRNRPVRSFTRIAAQLNAEHVPTRSGQPWNTENVRKLLRR
jgi:hypothetical protein